MSDFPTFGINPLPKLRSRWSMGFKLLVVCALALFMSIPALFIDSLVDERTKRADGVLNDISSHVGGEQTFLGPTLAVPYTILSPKSTPEHGTYFMFPEQAEAQIKVTTEERRRSLFKVPVFQSQIAFDATFDLSDPAFSAPQGAELNWKNAEILAGVSDPRGALSDATMTVGGKTVSLVATQLAQSVSLAGSSEARPRLTLLGAGLSAAQPNAQFHVASSLHFSGAKRLAVLPFGKTTHVTMEGDWPSPGFDGTFLPTTRTVWNKGFRAEWSVPFIARGVPAGGVSGALGGLGNTSLGVSFIEVADPYQSVTRSIKYMPLFVALVFLSYFVFEATTGKRVHVAQYLLVGLAQAIFYLLLLSLAERTGFDIGFLLGGVATVGLLSSNAGWVFGRPQAIRALAVFSLLYLLIFMLLRLEDNALLVGAVASFLAVAAAMYFTRRIDWYNSNTGPNAPTPLAS